MLPVANLLVSEYKWNLPVLFGICKTGGFINLCLIYSNESCCSFPQINGLPCLVKSYMGFSSFCKSGQNILRKFTTPAKLIHPLGVFGGCSFWIASSLFLSGCTHTFLFSKNILFPMYCKLVLNNWHFYGDIFNPFFNEAFNRSSNLFMCVSFDGVNSRRLSMITSQYFLLWRQYKIALIYNCHMDGEMFSPIGILWYK